ncbi:Transporter [Bacillus sp. IT-79MI2]|nr:hypothetical protein bmyco0002_19800 [Bacillus pseudomycoides]EEM11285.1 hypothetical protein bmyco0003_19800 [Bacillus pseudomycoides]EEM17119.1 hypothetical protein bpmyx0001_20490 [Bacillus pseudomycoides DSM 12442]OOG93473.1 hypothetical protein BTH41_03466 [Bacillus mycoides]
MIIVIEVVRIQVVIITRGEILMAMDISIIKESVKAAAFFQVVDEMA